jgi:hypothetical protein
MNLWQQLVETATTPHQVVEVARDFLASLSAEDLGSVPEDCRPRQIHDESDIDLWNLRLAEACRALWGSDRDGRMVTELAQFFQCASVRISRLGEPPADYAFNIH